MSIQIREKDIVRGEPRYADRCPLALAIRRATGRFVWVSFEYFFFGDTDNLQEWYYKSPKIPMPREAAMFIHRLDSLHIVRPCTLDLPIRMGLPSALDTYDRDL